MILPVKDQAVKKDVQKISGSAPKHHIPNYDDVNKWQKSGISPDYGRELRKTTRRARRRIAQRENDKRNRFFLDHIY